MTGLRYVGAPVADDPDLVYQDYVSLLKDEDLTTEQIDAAIESGLGSYVTKSYVEQQDALLADATYINAQDDLRVKLASKDVPNGVAALDATGKVSPNRINAPNSQRYLKGPYVPGAYMGAVDNITTSTLFTMPVADPGYPYRLLVFGEIDAHNSSDLDHAAIAVTVGSANGEVIAMGRGAQDAQETALLGDDFNRANAGNLGGGWEQVYSNSSGSYGVSGNRAAWSDGGNSNNLMTARRIDPTSAKTATDIQKVTAAIDAAGETGSNGGDTLFRIYLRVNADRTQYVFWEQSESTIKLMYNAGAGELQLGTTVASGNLSAGTDAIGWAGNAAAEKRKFAYLKNSTVVHQVEDLSGVTPMGPNNRGWGFGVRAVTRNLGQGTPVALDSIYVSDGVPNYQPIVVIPYNLTGAARTGATTLYIQATRAGTTSLSSVRPYRPRLHVMAVPA
ncbi:hypothetical protein KHO57_gp117 [Mycobacterium phage Phabba]|uniref:DUF7257 domain-containing protein n=1 Tax=Mycobacterium phage Phabba TaxID=2027899 RepID=A0A249XSR6_9CAUD|nr:hypothetical protein KHO57_gp117 [Mycobacterium phage Phabba]ASZ74787.1 hypothetical protein SEA_PHABBA_250 [Mycobacterium phage Phabba]